MDKKKLIMWIFIAICLAQFGKPVNATWIFNPFTNNLDYYEANTCVNCNYTYSYNITNITNTGLINDSYYTKANEWNFLNYTHNTTYNEHIGANNSATSNNTLFCNGAVCGTGGSANYTNIAYTNKSNNFTEQQNFTRINAGNAINATTSPMFTRAMNLIGSDAVMRVWRYTTEPTHNPGVELVWGINTTNAQANGNYFWDFFLNSDGTFNIRDRSWNTTPLNANRLTVTQAGNVGIGTTSPSSKLHVIGAEKINMTSTRALEVGNDTGYNTLVVDTTNKRVGIGYFGSSGPSYTFHEQNYGFENNFLAVSTFGVNLVGKGFLFNGARGTSLAPTSVVSGDSINSINTLAYNGTNYIEISRIQMGVGGAVSGAIVPGEVDFLIKDSSGNLNVVTYWFPDGTIRIPNLAGTGNAYVCVNSVGTLYRSAVAYV